MGRLKQLTRDTQLINGGNPSLALERLSCPRQHTVPSIGHENSVCSLNEITHTVGENENNHYLNVNLIVDVQ